MEETILASWPGRVRSWLAVASAVVLCVGLAAGRATAAPAPNLGPNVIVLSPSMSQPTIQTTLDSISSQQVPNQFGTQRYSIFFEPGTYGSSSDPLDFQLGFYEQLAGLFESPAE